MVDLEGGAVKVIQGKELFEIGLSRAVFAETDAVIPTTSLRHCEYGGADIIARR